MTISDYDGAVKSPLPLLIGVGLVLVPAFARSDDNLLHAVNDYLMKWNDFHFESNEVVTQGTAQQAPRYSERHARGTCQREKAQRRWSYTVTMSDDYKYPAPGELGPSLAGSFIVLPASLTGGINDKSWQKQPGRATWEKVTTNNATLATKLETDYLSHASVMDTNFLRAAVKKGNYPVFGAVANKNRKGDFYEVTVAKPQGYKYGFWVDRQTKQLMQVTIAKTEFGAIFEMTVGFWNVNKSAKPVIVAPTH